MGPEFLLCAPGPSYLKSYHLLSVTEPSLATSSAMPDKAATQGSQDVADDEDDEFGSAGVLDDSLGGLGRKKKLSQADQAVVVLSGITVAPDTLYQLEDTTTTVKRFLLLQSSSNISNNRFMNKIVTVGVSFFIEFFAHLDSLVAQFSIGQLVPIRVTQRQR